ncbi:MAG: polysaccharide deacetylase family protein [Bacteroidales bacterium]|nr:MAG: polysaccharide deacetylase family protein [Bacteroidales bacterium]
MNLLIYSYQESSRLKYILEILLSGILGISYDITHNTRHFKEFSGPKINYSEKDFQDKSLWIAPHKILYENKIVIQNITVSQWDGLKIFFQTDSGCALPFDIFAASFYLLSRYEEYLPFKADKFGRFEANESLAYKNGFLEEPVVNLWASKLKETLKGVYPQLSFPVKEFKYISTIDIDSAWAYLYKGFARTAGAFIKSLIKFSFSDFGKRIRVISGYEEDPYLVFDYLKEQESKYGFNSVYFFLTGRYGRFDKNISLKREVFRNLILEKIKISDTGIHPSYKSNKSLDLLDKEVKNFSVLLGGPVEKSRQHFLIARFPETFRRLIKLGIREDYTLGFSSAPGFRAGICNSFKFYDLSEERQTNLTLTPFNVMDVTLKEYMRLSADEAIGKIGEIITKIKSVNGTFVSLWHNESLSETVHWKGWRRVYEEMLGMIYD